VPDTGEPLSATDVRRRSGGAPSAAIVKRKVNLELQEACSVASRPDTGEMRRWIEAAIDASNLSDERACDVVVRIVDEGESRDLNCRYRNRDRATNVLAFPAEESAVPGLPPTRRKQLGDLAICGPVVEREALEQGKPAAGHWGHLLVHGTLHLLGYDHDTEDEAAEMERLEARIMADHGFDDPYV
jgi:probable rRNA maturation factor